MIRLVSKAALVALSAWALVACPSTPEGPAPRVPGIDTSALTEREQREYSSHVNSLVAPCPEVAVPVAQCITEKRACARCLPAAKAILGMVKDGMSPDQVATRYKNRWDPTSARPIPQDDSPVRGDDNAPVTIVEFADFECPSCERMFPVIEHLFAAFPGKVRFIYKFMPISFHPHGEPAAHAAFAAGQQGKFWEMHHLLFQHFGRLEQRDLDMHATRLGLDLTRFHADMESPAAKERVARDREAARALGVTLTPTIFVNGRMVDRSADLEAWVRDELEGR